MNAQQNDNGEGTQEHIGVMIAINGCGQGSD
jgi:hypothetical protein